MASAKPTAAELQPLLDQLADYLDPQGRRQELQLAYLRALRLDPAHLTELARLLGEAKQLTERLAELCGDG